MAVVITCDRCKKTCQFPASRVGSWESCPDCGRSLFLSPDVARPLTELHPGEDAPRPSKRPRKRSPLELDSVEPAPTHEPLRGRHPTGPVYENPPRAYVHDQCGKVTQVSDDVMRQIGADPWGLIFSTYCAGCGRHVSLSSVAWTGTDETVADYRRRLRQQTPVALTAVRFLLGPTLGLLLGPLAALLAVGHDPLVALASGATVGVVLGATVGYLVVGWLWQAFVPPQVPQH